MPKKKETTNDEWHRACQKRMAKEGGKARCCDCVPHDDCGDLSETLKGMEDKSTGCNHEWVIFGDHSVRCMKCNIPQAMNPDIPSQDTGMEDAREKNDEELLKAYPPLSRKTWLTSEAKGMEDTKSTHEHEWLTEGKNIRVCIKCHEYEVIVDSKLSPKEPIFKFRDKLEVEKPTYMADSYPYKINKGMEDTSWEKEFDKEWLKWAEAPTHILHKIIKSFIAEQKELSYRAAVEEVEQEIIKRIKEIDVTIVGYTRPIEILDTLQAKLKKWTTN